MTGQTKVSGVVTIRNAPAGRFVKAFSYESELHIINTEAQRLSRSLGEATSDPITGEYSIELTGNYEQEVFVVAFDNYGDEFTTERSLSLGDRIHPLVPTGYVFECVTAGKLPAVEPNWTIDTVTSHSYGTASMIAVPFYKPVVHGPVKPEVIVPVEVVLPTLLGEEYGGGFYAGDYEVNNKWYKLIFADAADAVQLAYRDPFNTNGFSNTIGDGYYNRMLLENDLDFKAMQYAIDYRGGGFGDWYIPSITELSLIITSLTGIFQSTVEVPSRPPSIPAPDGFREGQPQAFLEDQDYFSSTAQSGVGIGGILQCKYVNWYLSSIGNSSSTTLPLVRPVRRIEFTPEP